MKYFYTGIFENADEGGYAVSFPDLPGCYSQGDTPHEAFEMAQSALAQWLEYLIDKRLPIPTPSDIREITCENEGFVSLVNADLKEGRAVKRTVSIPKWMDERVSELGLSLSRVLQDALSQRFH